MNLPVRGHIQGSSRPTHALHEVLGRLFGRLLTGPSPSLQAWRFPEPLKLDKRRLYPGATRRSFPFPRLKQRASVGKAKPSLTAARPTMSPEGTGQGTVGARVFRWILGEPLDNAD